jgi:hypothetical protein
MITFIVFMFFSTLFRPPAIHLGEVRTIELKDGRVVTGEVFSSDNGIYTLHTTSQGSVQIEKSTIRTIRPIAPPAPVSSGIAPDKRTGDGTAPQNKTQNDKDAIRRTPPLRNDPAQPKSTEDPSEMKAPVPADAAETC